MLPLTEFTVVKVMTGGVPLPYLLTKNGKGFARLLVIQSGQGILDLPRCLAGSRIVTSWINWLRNGRLTTHLRKQ